MTALLFTLSMLLAPVQSTELEAVYEYLFSEEDRTTFNGLQTVEAQLEYFDQFWLRQDPTPDTFYNEVRSEFNRRLEAVLLYYPSSNFDGWRTDRGRVLIFFGFPVEIHRSPFAPSPGSKFEVWVYRSEDGQSVELTFEDENDTENFVLRTKVKFPDTISLETALPVIEPEEEPGV